MGGKVWSDEEERTFWSEIVPTSSKRHLLAKPYTDDAKGWESLRKVMQASMGRRARRKYTALMLYEHYFQNSVLERFSPNAARYVREYIKNERSSTGQAPSERSRSVLRFVQRGRGSGRRPKHTLAPHEEDQCQDQDRGLHPSQAQQQLSASARLSSPATATSPAPAPAPAQRRLHYPLPPPPPPPLLSAMSPLPAAVRLPPLSSLEAPPSVGVEASALCEPDYDFGHYNYQELAYASTAYEAAPAYPPWPAFQPPDSKPLVYQAHPAYIATAYRTPAYEAPLYANPAPAPAPAPSPAPAPATIHQDFAAYQAPNYDAPPPAFGAPAQQIRASRASTPANDSLFVKQEAPAPDAEDIKMPVHHYEALRCHHQGAQHQQEPHKQELHRYNEAAGEWYE